MQLSDYIYEGKSANTTNLGEVKNCLGRLRIPYLI